jgi:hypothetical protein
MTELEEGTFVFNYELNLSGVDLASGANEPTMLQGLS